METSRFDLGMPSSFASFCFWMETAGDSSTRGKNFFPGYRPLSGAGHRGRLLERSVGLEQFANCRSQILGLVLPHCNLAVFIMDSGVAGRASALAMTEALFNRLSMMVMNGRCYQAVCLESQPLQDDEYHGQGRIMHGYTGLPCPAHGTHRLVVVATPRR